MNKNIDTNTQTRLRGACTSSCDVKGNIVVHEQEHRHEHTHVYEGVLFEMHRLEDFGECSNFGSGFPRHARIKESLDVFIGIIPWDTIC